MQFLDKHVATRKSFGTNVTKKMKTSHNNQTGITWPSESLLSTSLPTSSSLPCLQPQSDSPCQFNTPHARRNSLPTTFSPISILTPSLPNLSKPPETLNRPFHSTKSSPSLGTTRSPSFRSSSSNSLSSEKSSDDSLVQAMGVAQDAVQELLEHWRQSSVKEDHISHFCKFAESILGKMRSSKKQLGCIKQLTDVLHNFITDSDAEM